MYLFICKLFLVAFKPKASGAKPKNASQQQVPKKTSFVVGADHKSPKPTKVL
jgi:hypothetical protein